jgi:putative YphP/YqiW family bacilliredoxin
MYPAEIVEPMKEELTENGFTELLSKEDVEKQLKEKGTTLIMINSYVVVLQVVPDREF